MEAHLVFSSTVLVFWATAFIPWFLRDNRHYLFAGSWILLFVVRLGLSWDPSDMTRQVAVSFVTMCIATSGGVVLYLYERRKKEQGNENTGEE